MKKEIAKLILSMGPLMDIKFFRAVQQQLKNGLSPLQIRILFMLRHGGSQPMTMLAEEMHMPKQQLTPLMDKLCGEGLVQRENSLEDRRVINVLLTEKGRNFIDAHDRAVQEIFAVKLSQLDDADLVMLQTSFNNAREILAKIT